MTGAIRATLTLAAVALGTFSLGVKPLPYIGGSRIAVHPRGYDAAFRLALLGPGHIEGSTIVAPHVDASTFVTVFAAGRFAAATARLHVVPPPRPEAALIAVASYGDGVVLHDPRTFAMAGVQPIEGTAGDVTFAPDGSLFAPDTDGTTLGKVTRDPWLESSVPGVASGNEVLAGRRGFVFVSDRDVAGKGALTRIGPRGETVRVVTGITAEGLALDATAGRIYVGNVNDASVLEVDARAMLPLRRIAAVPRVFGIALDAAARRLFVVSNVSRSMPDGPGFVAAIDLSKSAPGIVARSAGMSFPLGIALDGRAHRIFVTDEAANVVYVLDDRSLRAIRPPLATCSTPWRPHFDARRARLYVPCARADAVDVFDARSLRRIPGAPFRTGAFPLAVATWN